jgi:hypothetical protein
MQQAPSVVPPAGSHDRDTPTWVPVARILRCSASRESRRNSTALSSPHLIALARARPAPHLIARLPSCASPRRAGAGSVLTSRQERRASRGDSDVTSTRSACLPHPARSEASTGSGEDRRRAGRAAAEHLRVGAGAQAEHLRVGAGEQGRDGRVRL